MKIRGNTVGTTLKPKVALVKSENLTPEEQAQARDNIGAARSSDYGILVENKREDSYVEIDVFDKPDENGYPRTGISFLGYEDKPVRLTRVSDGIDDWDAVTVGQLRELENKGALVVTLTIGRNENGEIVYTVNHTYSEIIEAHNNGKFVYCVCTDSGSPAFYMPVIFNKIYCRFIFEQDLFFKVLDIYADGSVRQQQLSKEIDKTYNATSENAQSGKAVAQAVEDAKTYAENLLYDRVKILEFYVHSDLRTENGHPVYYCESGYSFEDIYNFADNFTFVYGLFYDGGLECAYPLIIDSREISFGNTFKPVYVDEAECWTDENSDANLLDSTLNTLWEQTHYVKLAETILQENAKEIIWTQGENGEQLSDYKEFFIYWVGSFENATTSGEPWVCRANDGAIYFCYHSTTKTTGKAGFWLHFEELPLNGIALWKSTYPESFTLNYSTMFNYNTQGLADNNRRVKSDISTTHASGRIEKLHFGSASTGQNMVAGSKAILWGVKR